MSLNGRIIDWSVRSLVRTVLQTVEQFECRRAVFCHRAVEAVVELKPSRRKLRRGVVHVVRLLAAEPPCGRVVTQRPELLS